MGATVELYTVNDFTQHHLELRLFIFDHLCAIILAKTVRERVKDEHAARSDSGPADSRGNRTSQGKLSLPR